MDFATPAVFTNARDDPNEEDDNETGQKLEIKMYQARYNWEDKRVRLSAGTKLTAWAPKEDSITSALSVTRYYDRDKELEYTEMKVRSPYIRKALREVVKEYPGLTFDTGQIIIRNEPKCIFHFREELRAYGTYLTDAIAAKHIVFFLEYMYSALTRELYSYYTFMEAPSAPPGIEFEFLWMAFKPGSLIVETNEGVHRILRFKSMAKYWASWFITAEKIVYDGERFGYVSEEIRIRSYEGYKPLTELRTCPLRYYPSGSEIRTSLVARGHKYVGMKEVSHRLYSGIAYSLSPYRVQLCQGEEDEYTIHSITIKGRIIVDIKKFGVERPTHQVDIVSTRTIHTDEDGMPMIADDDWCLFSSKISGYSLYAKRWCYFEVDRIMEFEYDKRAYRSLALDERQKSMLVSLVKAHSEGLDFDDLIKGKGKGMIFLLHGAPGTGKTLTAESLSDYTGRPLLSVSSGDLGVTATECEKALVDILDLATYWKAVLLIDEADVFLEQRSHSDLTRNGVVSVFLRLLEYFEGIMFLTTNNITNFDAAFKSRIHLAIKYPELSCDSQRQLWTTFVTNDLQYSLPDWLDDDFLDSLAANMLNGRQIRNAARTAVALAAAKDRELLPDDIVVSVKAITDFERDFSGTVGEASGNGIFEDGEYAEDEEASPERVQVSGKGPKRRRLA